MIESQLKKIGLTDGEIQVYMALLELGQSSTGAITKNAQIGSSKVYEVLQRLGAKGLSSFVIKNGVRFYDATPPERLIDFLEEKKNQLSESQNEIKQILPELKSHLNDKQSHNQTVVYNGPQGPKIALQELLEHLKSGGTSQGYGTDTDPYVEHLPHILQRFINQAKPFQNKTRLIFAKGFRSPNHTAQVRYVPKGYQPPVRTMIYGDKVAIVDFSKPWTTIIIEKQEIADAYVQHFELLWKLASP